MRDNLKSLAEDAGFDTEFMSAIMLVQLEIFATLIEKSVFEQLLKATR
jgi:hypothetical protein